MKSTKNFFSLLLLLTFCLTSSVFTGSAFADQDNARVGTRAFPFLKIEVSARPVSMGGAFTGLADDESALFYNPAGVATLEGKHYILAYQNNIFDIQSGFVGYIHPMGFNKKASIYLNYLNYGDMVRTDIVGNEEGSFGGSDMLLGLGYAMNLENDLQVGATLKLIYSKIDVFSAHGFALDLGVRKSLNYGKASVGATIQNLGVQTSNYTETAPKKDPLPLRLRVGASVIPRGLPVRLVGDVILPTDNDAYFALGAEIVEVEPLYLRFGWSSFGSNYKTGSSGDDISGFTFGFGVKHNNMVFSYGIMPQAELGT
ncbi:MAG: PorV/PorQ family protein, partial [candidate division Zixibacteria bacterium]|nr:PorV/PorQ family protein [candidate division Zixibacteria bacterium]